MIPAPTASRAASPAARRTASPAARGATGHSNSRLAGATAGRGGAVDPGPWR